jgi:hypothetical protein
MNDRRLPSHPNTGPQPGASAPGGDLVRGVRNPQIVDLIRPDAASGEIVLLMLEDRPWGGEDQLYQLEDKINRYLGYVLDGWLARQYPQYEGRPVRFELECREPPHGTAAELLRAAQTVCEGEGIVFAVRVGPADTGGPAP